MKLSIIIPVFNTGQSAKELVERLLPQQKDMEIILVDDGSTDDSLTVLKKLAKGNKRVRVLHQENAGQSAARNAGINISQGEYLIFLDSDDMVTEDYVSKMLGAIEANGETALAVCGMRYHWLVDDRTSDVYLKPLEGRSNRESLVDYVIALLLVDGRMYSSVNKIFRAELVRGEGLNFEEGRVFAEDTKFVLDYLAAAANSEKYSSGDIKFVLEPLYIYNFGTETSTVKSSATYWSNWERSYQDLTAWARELSSGGKLRIRTRGLLKLVRLRWRISHRRSVKRARALDKSMEAECGAKAEGHAWKFVVVGVVVTLFDFVLCTLLTRFIFGDNSLLWLATAIATFAATFLAYFMHSKITWKERNPGKLGIIKFFVWNMVVAFAAKPAIAWLFGLLTGLYRWAFGITSFMGLPFDYTTVEYLGVYALTTILVMTVNFFFYDKFIFGKRR